MSFINVDSYYEMEDGTKVYVCIHPDGSLKLVPHNDLVKAIESTKEGLINAAVINGKIERSSGEKIERRDFTVFKAGDNLIDKYSMTVEQNVFVAKRNIVDYIWKSAKLEGIAVTYPDTEAIYNGLIISGMHVDDIQAINNLKYAWRFILETVNYPTNYPLICKINQYVGSNLFPNSGLIRTVPVSIGGTNWKPDLPIEAQIKEELGEVLKLQGKTDKAITIMLYLMRKQMFLDGNKRTAMLTGNHVMVTNGVGIISVPIEVQVRFTELLVQYYESNDMKEIKQFVYDYCIDGIALE